MTILILLVFFAIAVPVLSWMAYQRPEKFWTIAPQLAGVVFVVWGLFWLWNVAVARTTRAVVVEFIRNDISDLRVAGEIIDTAHEKMSPNMLWVFLAGVCFWIFLAFLATCIVNLKARNNQNGS